LRHPFTEIIFAKCLKIRICYFIGTHFVKVRKATIIAYMKEAGYVKSDEDMLAFASDDDNDPHSPSIMYMIMNGQYFSATSMLMQVKKESVLTWMKQHYIYKGKNNGGLADLHNFISKDKKTSIMVSFMNLNESEYSTVTIAYQKEF